VAVVEATIKVAAVAVVTVAAVAAAEVMVVAEAAVTIRNLVMTVTAIVSSKTIWKFNIKKGLKVFRVIPGLLGPFSIQ
jgi:hypothetical protein